MKKSSFDFTICTIILGTIIGMIVGYLAFPYDDLGKTGTNPFVAIGGLIGLFCGAVIGIFLKLRHRFIHAIPSGPASQTSVIEEYSKASKMNTGEWTMFSTSKKEIAELLVDTGTVVIGKKTITVKGYPFEPSIAYRYKVFEIHEITEIDPDSFPPTILAKNELIPIPSKQKSVLMQFAANNGIPTIHRPYIWDWILEPFLDTEFTDETKTRLDGFLAEYGLGSQEVRTLRQEVETQMLKYNFDTMLWEWVSLGLYDVLRAMRTNYDKKHFEDFFRRAMAIALSEKPPSTKE